MEQLHIQWMDLPGPTDVLSFPMDELRPPARDDEEPPQGAARRHRALPRGRRAGRAPRPATRTAGRAQLLPSTACCTCSATTTRSRRSKAEMFGLQAGCSSTAGGRAAADRSVPGADRVMTAQLVIGAVLLVVVGLAGRLCRGGPRPRLQRPGRGGRTRTAGAAREAGAGRRRPAPLPQRRAAGAGRLRDGRGGARHLRLA